MRRQHALHPGWRPRLRDRRERTGDAIRERVLGGSGQCELAAQRKMSAWNPDAAPAAIPEIGPLSFHSLVDVRFTSRDVALYTFCGVSHFKVQFELAPKFSVYNWLAK